MIARPLLALSLLVTSCLAKTPTSTRCDPASRAALECEARADSCWTQGGTATDATCTVTGQGQEVWSCGVCRLPAPAHYSACTRDAECPAGDRCTDTPSGIGRACRPPCQTTEECPASARGLTVCADQLCFLGCTSENPACPSAQRCDLRLGHIGYCVTP